MFISCCTKFVGLSSKYIVKIKENVCIGAEGGTCRYWGVFALLDGIVQQQSCFYG